jgi:predicted transcriptional regulator
MKKHEVKDIIVSIDKNLAAEPSVAEKDNITEAIEVLLNNNLKQIAVTRKDAVIGMIRLEDALK